MSRPPELNYSLLIAAQDGQTALHCAALLGHSVIVASLMSEGCVKDAINKVRRPPPSRGPSCPWPPELKFSPFIATQDGQTALHCAALKGHVEVVSVLVAGGCDVDVADKVWCPPLPGPPPGRRSIRGPARNLCRREMLWSSQK